MKLIESFRDKDNLGKDENLRQQLLQQLIRRYAILTNAPDVAFVLRKLCSTLVTYFVQPTSGWQFPVRDVLASILEHGSASQFQYVTQLGITEINSLVPSMKAITYEQLRSVLWLSLSLVEDVLRSEPKGADGYDTHIRAETLH